MTKLVLFFLITFPPRCLGKSPWEIITRSIGTTTSRRFPRRCCCSSGDWVCVSSAPGQELPLCPSPWVQADRGPVYQISVPFSVIVLCCFVYLFCSLRLKPRIWALKILCWIAKVARGHPDCGCLKFIHLGVGKANGTTGEVVEWMCMHKSTYHNTTRRREI